MKETTIGVTTVGETKTVTFSEESANKLKEYYELAVANGSEEFTFQGNDYLVSYAKYLLEYLKTKGLLK